MDKENILNNVEDFTSEQLFNFISLGLVTLDELKRTGNLDASKRNAITELQNQLIKDDNDSWQIAMDRNTLTGFREYLKGYPNGKHKTVAEEKIVQLEQKNKEEETERKRILEKIKQNPNTFPTTMIRKYLKDGTLKRIELTDIGIPVEIIDQLDNIHSTSFDLGETPNSIPDGYTEVYFWGIRGSGKTTALSAVLSTANKLGYLEIAQGPGYNYMLQLQNNFIEKISTLPAGTNTDVTQYLPFTLKKLSEKYYRSVSLIELSGEIFQCFLYKNANKPLPTVQHEETFNSLLRFLKGDNRKIHFFFIDYDRENSVDQDGYTQSNYLNAAATFFNSPQYNLFGNTTDAIYVVVTKSDLMPETTNSRVQQISQYLQKNNYTSFINSLKAKCSEHSINNGRVLATPFSLGNVYFTELCDFNDETSRNIIDILMRRIAPRRNSLLDVFNK